MKVLVPWRLLLVAFMAVKTVASDLDDAEEARWLVNTGNWGVLSYTEPKEEQFWSFFFKHNKQESNLRSDMVSFADDNGQIFFYLMGEQQYCGATLTLSEAALEPTSNFKGAACGEDGAMDPEDPRCAKLSIQGSLKPCQDESTCEIGKKALFDRHPEMGEWPESHHFTVHQLDINDIWMISNYGGGANISMENYEAASPKHHPHGSPTPNTNDSGEDSFVGHDDGEVPDWDNKVERARWIVAHSLWTTVSTFSVRLDSAWGNIRSMVDGSSYQDSTGKPVFYLPTPDPTSIDVSENPTISLTFSEAALAERLSDDGQVCGGLDPMDPLCARVTITGKAVEMKCDNAIQTAQDAFGARHPLAPWLAENGAHTGGAYYTIEPYSISILDYYGGATEICIKEYLEWKAPSKETPQNQQQHKLGLRGSEDASFLRMTHTLIGHILQA